MADWEQKCPSVNTYRKKSVGVSPWATKSIAPDSFVDKQPSEDIWILVPGNVNTIWDEGETIWDFGATVWDGLPFDWQNQPINKINTQVCAE